MTHTRKMDDSEGTFGTPNIATDIKCPNWKHCTDRGPVTERAWDSFDGAYTDYKYTCGGCGHTWWVEGPDA